MLAQKLVSFQNAHSRQVHCLVLHYCVWAYALLIDVIHTLIVHEIAQKEDKTVHFIRKAYTLHPNGYILASEGLFLSCG